MISRNLIKIPLRAVYFKYKKFRHESVRPVFINFITTYQCNCRCAMCRIWETYLSSADKLKDELSLAEIREFLLKNKDFLKDLRHIGLTGGEPFLRKDIIDIVRSIREILPKVKTGIQTNGQLPFIKEKISEIVSFYPGFSLAVSIDGIKDVHDKIRGINGAFEKAIDLIKFSLKLGIPVSSGMTLNRLNYKQVKEVKDLVTDLGAEFSCFLPENAEYFRNLNSVEELGEAAKQEIAQSLRGLFGHNYYMDNLRCLLTGEKKKQAACYSGYTSLVLDPYGEIKPCILRSEPFGNIKQGLLKDMLTSKSARQLRKNLKNCFCWCQCEVSASAVIDPTDVMRWFLFRCRDRRGFLKEFKRKQRNLS